MKGCDVVIVFFMLLMQHIEPVLLPGQAMTLPAVQGNALPGCVTTAANLVSFELLVIVLLLLAEVGTEIKPKSHH